MKAWTDKTWSLNLHKAESGWIVRRQSSDSRMVGDDVAALSDEEGLLEWFAAQLGFDGHKLQARPPNPGSVAEAAGANYPAADAASIQRMVDRFLSWRLPVDFCPDAGITLKPSYDPQHASGTNLFTATQAMAMVRHMLDGPPRSDDDTGAKASKGADADAPVRARASVEDASHAGASGADHKDTMQAASAQAAAPGATPAAVAPPPADEDDGEVDF